MGATEDLLQSRDELMTVLDEKLKNYPEWRAFRAVDRAIAALAPTERMTNGSDANRPPRNRPADAPLPYRELGTKALDSAGKPVTTPEMVEFISKHRDLPPDPDKARANIVSALSHDDAFQSVAWRGGRAWWYSDRPVPIERRA